MIYERVINWTMSWHILFVPGFYLACLLVRTANRTNSLSGCRRSRYRIGIRDQNRLAVECLMWHLYRLVCIYLTCVITGTFRDNFLPCLCICTSAIYTFLWIFVYISVLSYLNCQWTGTHISQAFVNGHSMQNEDFFLIDHDPHFRTVTDRILRWRRRRKN